MARQYSVTCAATSLSAATAKSLVELVCTSADIAVIEFDISFNGTTFGATPALIDLIRYTTTGTGSAFTPLKYRQEVSLAATTTAKTNLTVEGTGSITTLRQWYISPTGGLVMQFPLGREPSVASGNASNVLALRVNVPATVSAVANIIFEE